MHITVGDRNITIHELAVADMREYLRLAEADELPIDPVTDLLFEDFSLRDLEAMTSLSVEDMDHMTPSEIYEVGEACKKVNAHFFAMADRANKLVTRLASQISTVASQLSLEPGTRLS